MAAAQAGGSDFVSTEADPIVAGTNLLLTGYAGN